MAPSRRASWYLLGLFGSLLTLRAQGYAPSAAANTDEPETEPARPDSGR